MGLLSSFTGRREGSTPAAKPAPADPVQAARTQARHRLIGAVVLLLAGIVGFPIVFETQPRPTPVDVAIEIPRKDGSLPLVVPAPRVAAPQATRDTPSAATGVAGARGAATRESVAPSVPAPAAARASAAAGADSPPPARAAAPAVERPASAPTTAPAARAQEASGSRWVVQVGAFADAAAAQAMRSKAEKLGLKTYTQLTDTATGNRVRVRIGPFATREAAEQALAKAKAGGLNAVVLTL
jgi:DedD protein